METKQGAGAMERLLSGASALDRHVMTGVVIQSGWYPLGSWNRMLDRYVTESGSGDERAFRPIAEFISENDLTRIFKMLLTVASPGVIVARAGFLWSRFLDVLSSMDVWPSSRTCWRPWNVW